MNLFSRFRHEYVVLSEDQAETLSQPDEDWYSVTVKPASTTASVPESVTATIKAVLEMQTGFLGFRNRSPVAAYEIRRTTPDNLSFQFSLPTKRLERKLRTHLNHEIPEVEFEPGKDGLPVTEGDSVGGALLTPRKRDWYPLQTSHDFPPMNSVASALHRHAMQDTRIVIQLLFQPVAGRPIRSWWRTKRMYQQIGYLRKEKEKLWHNRSPTPREKQQAKAIERKAGTIGFHTSIRVLIIGAEEYMRSRVKEVSGAFNIFDNPDTGQYLNTHTVHTLVPSRIYNFAETVTNRRFGNWHRRFQASIPELAALVSIPNHSQQNIQYSD